MSSTRRLTLLDAPSNLGLSPPAQGVVPGVSKLAGALRDQRLLDRLGALDAGVVTPPRYLPDHQPGLRTRNHDALAEYTPRLAARIDRIIDDGGFPLVLGGDCSILLGSALALRRRGRFGLAYVDGHGDFRHPGNADSLGAAAGEDLAIVAGRGPVELADIDGLHPYVDDDDVIVLGIRDDDGWRKDLDDAGIALVPASRCHGRGGEAARTALKHFDRPGIEGFWLHLDVDVLDETLMPAVDSPEPDGLDWDDLADLITPLTNNESIAGMQITIFDPDLDPDGALAASLANFLVTALSGAHAPAGVA